MALIDCRFYSETLRVCTSLQAIIPRHIPSRPDLTAPEPRHRWPVVWLLHGLSDDDTGWLRRTSIERYVTAHGLAVIMPDAGRSFYADMKHGPAYWQFISQELPAIASSLFPISTAREDNFVAGISMGGYGAMKLALRCPERFAAVAALSGAFAITPEIVESHADLAEEMRWIFGDLESIPGSENDLFHLAEEAVTADRRLPAVYMCCGTEDFLFSVNEKFRDHLRRLNVPLRWEGEPGTHEWGYWDRKLPHILDWMRGID